MAKILREKVYEMDIKEVKEKLGIKEDGDKIFINTDYGFGRETVVKIRCILKNKKEE